MREAVTRWAGRLSGLIVGPLGPMPTRQQLLTEARQYLAGSAMLLLAAKVVNGSGHADQQWQYVAMAAALIPQVLVVLLARQDRDRRARLRISPRPSPLLLLVACLLAITGAVSLLAGSAIMPGVAALCAAMGFAIPAAPLTVRFAPSY